MSSFRITIQTTLGYHDWSLHRIQTLENQNCITQRKVCIDHLHMGSWRPCRSQRRPHREQRRTRVLRTATPTPHTIHHQTYNQSTNQIKSNRTHPIQKPVMRPSATYWIRPVLPCRCAGRGGRCRAPGRACRCPTPARRS